MNRSGREVATISKVVVNHEVWTDMRPLSARKTMAST
jgi:uncharacterized protein YbdZ (MbtH family)